MKYVGENALKKWTSLVKSDIKKKLDKNQGTANSGKILGVDASGEVAPTDTEVATLVDVPNGIVKGDGSTLSAAVAGTDYMAPVTGGTAGQVLTKTADGQEWTDLENVFIIPGTKSREGIVLDKTFLEIKEAYNAGKVCFLVVDNFTILHLIAITDKMVMFSASATTNVGLVSVLTVTVNDENNATITSTSCQNKITTYGLLKGNGNDINNISAAIPGTDYMVPPTGGTTGQVLTKTADGQEWKDREKSTFIVTISGDSGTGYTADKTFLEIQEAYDAGKVCFALYTEIVLPLIAFDKEIGVGFGQKMERGLFYSFLIGADDTITLNVYEAQNKITASGLLKGDGKGGVSAATAGTDYMVPPTGGTVGQVLTKTANSSEWADAPKSLPDGGTAGDALVKSTDGGSWETPVEASLVEIMTKSEVEAAIAASSAKITASTTDLTAGTSPLATGELYVVYE